MPSRSINCMAWMLLADSRRWSHNTIPTRTVGRERRGAHSLGCRANYITCAAFDTLATWLTYALQQIQAVATFFSCFCCVSNICTIPCYATDKLVEVRLLENIFTHCVIRFFWQARVVSVKFFDIRPFTQKGNGTKYVEDTNGLNDRFDV